MNSNIHQPSSSVPNAAQKAQRDGGEKIGRNLKKKKVKIPYSSKNAPVYSLNGPNNSGQKVNQADSKMCIKK